jgi:hypothetical protein
MIGEAVMSGESGKFSKLEDAVAVAALALNYIMDQVDEEVDDGEESS